MSFFKKTSVLIAIALFASLSLADSAPSELKAVEAVPMSLYRVWSQNVSSVDVLIDYEIVLVDCDGLDKSYSAAMNEVDHQVFVSKTYIKKLHYGCFPQLLKPAQSGIMITLKPDAGSDSVNFKLFAPEDSIVKVVEHAKQKTDAVDYVCKESVNCMMSVDPKVDHEEKKIYCAMAYRKWAQENCTVQPEFFD